jgi:DNA-binding transcriptional LysR family regulator
VRGLKLRQIETFCELARQGSLALTAERLSLTESAISVSVHELEKQLGESLFNKQGRRLVLSDRGRELLPQALELIERAENFGEVGNTGRTQALAIGATRSIGPHLLPRLIRDFERHLNTRIGLGTSAETNSNGTASIKLNPKLSKRNYELFVQNSEIVLSRLSERTLDMALVEGEVLDPSLHKRTWLSDQLIIFCRAGHPLLSKTPTLNSLNSASWALRESGSGTREIFLRALAPLLPTLNIEVETSDNATLSEIVASSDCLGCLSRRVVENELESGKLIEINAKNLDPSLEKSLRRSLWIVTHPQRHQRAVLSQLIAFAQKWQ